MQEVRGNNHGRLNRPREGSIDSARYHLVSGRREGKEKGGEVVICCNWFFETSLRDFRFKRSVWSDFRDWTVAPLFGPLLFGSLS